MARPQLYSDEEILRQLEDFWALECCRAPKLFTYETCSGYLKRQGMEMSANTLRHREAVVGFYQDVKAGRKSSPPLPGDAGVSRGTEEADKKLALLKSLVTQAIAEAACRTLLNRVGMAFDEDAGLRPGAVDWLTIGPYDRPFEAGYLKMLNGISDTPEEEDGNEGIDGD